MELAKEIIPTLPNLKALIFEILEDFVRIKIFNLKLYWSR
jgi:hypothetical protein